MGYLYRNISIYVDEKDNLYIVPTGRSEKWGGFVAIDLITKLASPYYDNEIETAINKAFDQCFTMKPNETMKETAIERYLKVKGYSKAVKDKRLVDFFWNVDEGYIITPAQRLPRQGYDHMNDKAIMLGLDPKSGEIARAIREAIKLATI